MSFLLDGAGNKPKAVLKSATTMKRPPPPPHWPRVCCVVLSVLCSDAGAGRLFEMRLPEGDRQCLM